MGLCYICRFQLLFVNRFRTENRIFFSRKISFLKLYAETRLKSSVSCTLLRSLTMCVILATMLLNWHSSLSMATMYFVCISLISAFSLSIIVSIYLHKLFSSLVYILGKFQKTFFLDMSLFYQVHTRQVFRGIFL